MEFGQFVSHLPISYGLSAIPIDGQTFQLVNLTPAHNPNSSVAQDEIFNLPSVSTPSTVQRDTRTRLFSDTFLDMLSSLLESSGSQAGSSSSSPSLSPSLDTSHNQSSLSSSSSICEDRPLPDSFMLQPVCTSSSEVFTSPSSTVPQSSIHPYFSFLSQILETDLKDKKLPVTKPAVIAMERKLFDQFQQLEALDYQQVSNLRDFYKYQSSKVELERTKAIYKYNGDSSYKDLLNSQYDQQLIQIINRVTQSVHLLRKSLLHQHQDSQSSDYSCEGPFTSTPCKQQNKQFMAAATRQQQNDQSSYPFTPTPYKMETSLSASFPYPTNINTGSTPCDVTSIQIPNQCNINPVPKTRPVLSKQTIVTLEAWYKDHEEHPYPNMETTASLAERGGIATNQVRKWFANKRSRSKNTKTLSAIACRNRWEKYGNMI